MTSSEREPSGGDGDEASAGSDAEGQRADAAMKGSPVRMGPSSRDVLKRTSEMARDPMQPGVTGRFGAMIRSRRLELGLTLGDVAGLAGCAKSYLSLVETGRRAPPKAGIVERIAEALRLPSAELVEAAASEHLPESARRGLEGQTRLLGTMDRSMRLAVGLLDAGELAHAREVLRTGIHLHEATLLGPEARRRLRPSGVVIADTAMLPAYAPGDVVLTEGEGSDELDPGPEGRDVVCRLDHGIACRRCYRDGEHGWRLQPLDVSVQPVAGGPAVRERIVGTVTAVVRPVGRSSVLGESAGPLSW